MQDLNDLYYFTQIVDKGGFAAAGRHLGIPKSRLSRRIAELEGRLGARLLHRTTRRLSLTDVGQRYYQRCLAMLVEAEAAQDVVDRMQAEPRGALRVSCPVALAQTWLAPLLPRFLAAHPDVQISLLVTNRRVDLLEERFDVALRVRTAIENSSLVIRLLGLAATLLVAGPRLVQRHGRPQVPADLADLPAIGRAEPDGRIAWRLHGEDGVEHVIALVPRLASDDMAVLRSAAVEDIGAVALPEAVCRDDLSNGSLVHLLPGWQLPRSQIHAVLPSRRGMMPSVRSFIEFLAQHAAQRWGPGRGR